MRDKFFNRRDFKMWIIDRTKEPSTWAAVAIGCIIAAIMLDSGWPLIVAGVCAVGAVLLKEKII